MNTSALSLFAPPPASEDQQQEQVLGLAQETLDGAGEAQAATTRLPDQPAKFTVRTFSDENLTRLVTWCDPITAPNIAEDLDDALLSQIGQTVIEELNIDESSREAWLTAAKKALDMAMQKSEAKTWPWPNASNVKYPLIAQAATQFASRAYPAIIQNRSVVKAAIVGDDSGVVKTDPTGQPVINPQTQGMIWIEGQEPGAKAARAKRVAEHMSWQLLEEMPEWETETDTLLSVLPVVGCEFRKSFFDNVEGRNVSIRISAQNLVVNYWARSIKTAPRISEYIQLYPYEIRERVADGRFLPNEYSAPLSTMDSEAPHKFVEQHRRLDLDGDGYPEPYIVTVHIESRRVARILANYEADGIKINKAKRRISKIKAIEYYTKYDFLPNIEGGFYGHGWAQYLLGINESINTTLNMLFDSAHLQTVGGGFIGKGLSLHSGELRFRSPGEYKQVNALGSTVRENIVQLDHKGPSPALISLLTMLIDAGKDIAAIKDILTGELKAQTMSPTVFTSIVEQGLKVFTSIYKRVFRALKEELEKLYRLNAMHMPDTVTFTVQDKVHTVTRDDYQVGAGIEPIADPGMVVEAQKLARTQVLAEFKDDPAFDGREIRKRVIEAAGIENSEKLLNGQPAPNPELLLQTGELEIKRMVAKSQVIANIAQAVKSMAEADAKVNEPFTEWLNGQMENLKNEIDGQQANSGGSQGSDAGPDGAAPAPPGDESAAMLPA